MDQREPNFLFLILRFDVALNTQVALVAFSNKESEVGPRGLPLRELFR